MNKKNLILLILILCVLLVPMAGSLAYLTQTETAHNVITTGNVDIELQEFSASRDNPDELVPFENAEGVLPGEAISKIVQVKNTGSGDAWVRVKLSSDIEIPADTAVPESYQEGVFPARPDINSRDWTEEDGFYYYNKPLAPGETTEPIMTEVMFSPDMGNEYTNVQFSITVVAYAVQAANNGEAVLDAEGWPAESMNSDSGNGN